jgi:hypothetical protein
MLSEEKQMEVLETRDLTKSLQGCRSADQRHHHTGSRHIERPTAKARTGIVHEGRRGLERFEAHDAGLGGHAQGLRFCLAIRCSRRPQAPDSSWPEFGVIR